MWRGWRSLFKSQHLADVLRTRVIVRGFPPRMSKQHRLKCAIFTYSPTNVNVNYFCLWLSQFCAANKLHIDRMTGAVEYGKVWGWRHVTVTINFTDWVGYLNNRQWRCAGVTPAIRFVKPTKLDHDRAFNYSFKKDGWTESWIYSSDRDDFQYYIKHNRKFNAATICPQRRKRDPKDVLWKSSKEAKPSKGFFDFV